ncbi:MAG: protease [Candidatus Scalindua rubra]|uniref:Protease n=1 Tax=Candidatus Scalindua rubra TaxID=1872076 RepID=A0A1E3XGR8_9BACT|nr:MAG: protease [Candidatus Scalindua rubra]
MYMKFSSFLNCKIIICFIFLVIFTQRVFAENEADKLKRDILELEKIANPFVQIFRKISSLVGPSVVSIVAEGAFGTHTDPHDRFPSPFFSPREKDKKRPGADRPSFGSGIVVKKTGYILTNFHVIDGFENGRISVTLHNGDRYDAMVVGKDSNTDLAILKIGCDNLREVTFGDPKSVNVGDWVIAIGSPFGYSQTVSAGIVSAIGRTHVTPLAKPFAYENFIQTDAAINPGNSGGPLVNLRGEIIGINSAIATRTGGFQGVGFAISVEIANEVISDLIEEGRVVRGYLGVGIQDINDTLASYLNLNGKSDVMRKFRLDSDKGAFISEVWQDTPASKGGINPGDVIIEFGDQRVLNVDDLQRAIRVSVVDSKVKVKVIRNKKEEVLVIKIDQQPENMSGKTYVTIRQFLEQASLNLGLAVENLILENEKEHGVLVKHVEANSPAERAGILPGDIILKVGSKNVNSVEEFQLALKEFLEIGLSVSVFVKSKGFVTLK